MRSGSAGKNRAISGYRGAAIRKRTSRAICRGITAPVSRATFRLCQAGGPPAEWFDIALTSSPHASRMGPGARKYHRNESPPRIPFLHAPAHAGSRTHCCSVRASRERVKRRYRDTTIPQRYRRGPRWFATVYRTGENTCIMHHVLDRMEREYRCTRRCRKMPPTHIVSAGYHLLPLTIRASLCRRIAPTRLRLRPMPHRISRRIPHHRIPRRRIRSRIRCPIPCPCHVSGATTRLSASCEALRGGFSCL